MNVQCSDRRIGKEEKLEILLNDKNVVVSGDRKSEKYEMKLEMQMS